ncbi:hypothetical protein D5086_006173, partial [Populus alba]
FWRVILHIASYSLYHTSATNFCFLKGGNGGLELLKGYDWFQALEFTDVLSCNISMYT